MSNPDPPPPSDPKSSDFRRVPRPAPDAGDDAPPQHSDFLSICGSVLTILFGVLLLPGICSFYPNLTSSVIAIAAVVGLAMIVGGIVWATRSGGARRR
jgi:hypothetical protein